jgi:hypothetical protein
MVYFVFDMDETLGNLYSVHYFLCDLRRETMLDDMDPPSKGLKNVLDTAYQAFVTKVATKEAQPERLGVLRPGIFHIMRLLSEAKKAGAIKGVVIYSNNASLGALHFIRDVIHAHIGNSDLICDCIHWGHEAREYERGASQGSAKKTWSVLKSVLLDGPCKASETIDAKDVYFIDDQMHPDLKRNLPMHHYIQVRPYDYKAPFETLAQYYKGSLEEAGLFEDPVSLEEYFTYVNEGCLKKEVNTIDAVLTRYKGATRTVPVGTPVPAPDMYTARIIQLIHGIKRGGGSKLRANHKKRQQSRRRNHGSRHTRKAFR